MSSTRVSDHYLGKSGAQYVDARQSVTDHPGYEFNLRAFRPFMKADDVVLDFGCGNGGMLRRLAAEHARVDGLEVNPAAAELAREGGATVYGGLDELPTEPTYDVIVSNHVLEHIRDVCATLERLRACLKPGGRFITKLPIDDPNAKHQRGWSKDDVDHHLQTWTPRLFANVLFESGYDVEVCRVITSAWHPKLFWLAKFGLDGVAFRMLAILRRRRQLLAVGVRPA